MLFGGGMLMLQIINTFYLYTEAQYIFCCKKKDPASGASKPIYIKKII